MDDVEATRAAEDRAIWGQPTYLVNRSWVTWSEHAIRIAFAEQGTSGPPHPRTAVGMAPGDAKALAEAILRALELRAAPPAET